LLAAVLLACSSSGGAPPPAAPPAPASASAPPLAVELGTGDGSPESVTFTVIADASAKLAKPRDLAFNNMEGRTDELWVVNHDTDSTTIVFDASTDARRTEWRKDGYALHFMAEPASITFGALETTFGKPGTFATCQESRNTYDGKAKYDDFMGPTLWSSDFEVYAVKNPIGLGSHIDMLHNTPLCMGIEHDSGNVYWALGGLSGAIYRYDFGKDHGIGMDDHSDGTVYEYVTGQVKYAPGIPSHLALDRVDHYLYAADTGNGRVVRLDVTTGTKGEALHTHEPTGESRKVDGAILDVTVPPGVLEQPSGLELRGELVYVSDHATGVIAAFRKDGTEVRRLDTGLGPGALAGMAFGPADGRLYFVDMKGNRVLRVDP